MKMWFTIFGGQTARLEHSAPPVDVELPISTGDPTMTRDPLYKTAVIVHALASAFGILFAFPALLQGPTAQGIAQGVPQVVLVLSALLGVAGLVSAYGAWYGQKWGIWLTILTEALNGLLALPGVLFAPSAAGRISAVAGVLIAIFVIVVMLRRPRPAVQ
jgi:hypothetical protein